MITWLASYPKSGNTWLRLLFNAVFTGGPVNINKFYWGKSDNDTYTYSHLAPKNYSDLTESEILLLRSAALFHLLEASAQNPLLMKTHNCYGSVDGIPLFPKSVTNCAFYIVRDPREVAPSMSTHYRKPLDWVIEKMADTEATIGDTPQRFSFLSSWSEHVKRWTQCRDFPVYIIEYWKLKEDPALMLGNILKLLQLKATDKQINNAVEATRIGTLKVQEKKIGFKENPGKELFFGGDRPTLTARQKQQIENDHGEMMEFIGVK